MLYEEGGGLSSVSPRRGERIRERRVARVYDGLPVPTVKVMRFQSLEKEMQRMRHSVRSDMHSRHLYTPYYSAASSGC